MKTGTDEGTDSELLESCDYVRLSAFIQKRKFLVAFVVVKKITRPGPPKRIHSGDC